MADIKKVIAWLADTELYYQQEGSESHDSDHQCRMAHDAISVIEAQQAEIERLEKENGTLKLAVQSMPNWLDEKRPEVVRCKDCCMGEPYPRETGKTWCHLMGEPHKDDWFCGDGTRKDGDGE